MTKLSTFSLPTRSILATLLATGLFATAAVTVALARSGGHDHPARYINDQMTNGPYETGYGPTWWVPGVQEGRNAAMIDNQAAMNGDRAILQAEQQQR